jgi:S-adenosylmethionine hydrolase
MSIITLLTDFGIEDEYVGLMKGIILSIHPSVSIVDITHQVDPQDIVQAAYTTVASYPYFPEGTVHIVVVDPGVGSRRNIIALQAAGHFFVAPDNGVLTLVLDDHEPGALVKVDNSDFFQDTISETFHGRDIIAPIGAYIAKGISLADVGSEYHLSNVVRLPELGARTSQEGKLVGKIITVDRFGNLITNVSINDLQTGTNRSQADRKPQIRIGRARIDGLVRTYSDAGAQTAVALIGSRGYLEVAINGGSAQAQLNAKKGDRVEVIF